MSILQGYDIEIRHIPGKVNPADTLTQAGLGWDVGEVAKVKDVDRELVDMIRVAESATDTDIQMKLKELYSKEDEREKREQVRGLILSEVSAVEDQAILSVVASRVNITNDFRERLVRGILADEDYTAIWTKLQDPNETNEVTERARTYRIKRGILKTHEENQSSMYEYWRTVIPNDEGTKRTVMRALLRAPRIGTHPGSRQDQLLLEAHEPGCAGLHD